MIGFILYLIVIGLVAGFIARALVPGKDAMSVGATIVLGIVGSFIGGFIGYALTHKDADDGAFQAVGHHRLGRRRRHRVARLSGSQRPRYAARRLRPPCHSNEIPIRTHSTRHLGRRCRRSAHRGRPAVAAASTQWRQRWPTALATPVAAVVEPAVATPVAAVAPVVDQSWSSQRAFTRPSPRRTDGASPSIPSWSAWSAGLPAHRAHRPDTCRARRLDA